MPRGAPDFHRIMVVRYEVVPVEEIGRVTPLPIGNKTFDGSTDATSIDWSKITGYVVPDGRKFHLTKILFSCVFDTWFRIKWAGETKYGPILIPAKMPYPDWFPLSFLVCEGDGVKELSVEAKYYATSGYAYVQVVGELE